MKEIAAVASQIIAKEAIKPQLKSENKSSITSVNFTNIFDIVRRSFDGVMVVAESNNAALDGFDKNKLEVEKKREFKTDLEQAQEIVGKIAKILEKQGKSR